MEWFWAGIVMLLTMAVLASFVVRLQPLTYHPESGVALRLIRVPALN
jgi:hypothetical protein